MTTKALSIAGIQTRLLLVAVGLISIVVHAEPAGAKPKKVVVSQSCTCGCEFKDSEGTWQWGDDVNFSSSDCRQWKNKKQSCFSNGNLHDGRLTMCMPVQKDTEAGFQGNAGVDAGASTQPGSVGGATGGALQGAGGRLTTPPKKKP